jgi:DNA-binding NtrC family response regulator
MKNDESADVIHNGHKETNLSAGMLSAEEPSDSVVKTKIISQAATSYHRILIMDDDEIVRMVLEQLLKKAGYNVTGVENGDETIETYKNAFESDPFALVIIDLTIHTGLGGKETVKALKEFDPSAKTVVFSGYSQDPIVSDYAKYGFDAVLGKPFTSDELHRMLKSVLGHT